LQQHKHESAISGTVGIWQLWCIPILTYTQSKLPVEMCSWNNIHVYVTVTATLLHNVYSLVIVNHGCTFEIYSVMMQFPSNINSHSQLSYYHSARMQIFSDRYAMGTGIFRHATVAIFCLVCEYAEFLCSHYDLI
jgi:hypothetical protein